MGDHRMRLKIDGSKVTPLPAKDDTNIPLDLDGDLVRLDPLVSPADDQLGAVSSGERAAVGDVDGR